MNEIISGVTMFTVVVLDAGGAAAGGPAQAGAVGDVTITINDDPACRSRCAAGNTLLGTLGDNKIFIPSACGGKGACGVCEVIVKEGGGTLLPTETGFINRGEAKRGCRLACQVKVKRDMASRSRPRSSTCASGTARSSPTATWPPSSRNSSWPCPKAKKCPSAPAAMCSSSARRTTSSFKSFDIEAQYRDDWDKFDLWRFKSLVEPIERAYSMANYPLEKGQCCCSPSASPSRPATRRNSAGHHEQLCLQPEAGR
jgi:Na+-transporting NADH:ubiquinone oxidoreductase subunit F